METRETSLMNLSQNTVLVLGCELIDLIWVSKLFQGLVKLYLILGHKRIHAEVTFQLVDYFNFAFDFLVDSLSLIEVVVV